jgi:2-polyprenyl-3-methyl-5-hydroxy-6-metoxy-1,4-benzoquinol methylase
MTSTEGIDGYSWIDGELTSAHGHLLPTVTRLLTAPKKGASLFDLGCGNGAVTAYCKNLGYRVRGIDASVDGIEQARRAHPDIPFDQASAYEDLVGVYGQFDVILSLEVVEHLYSPRQYAATLYNLCKVDGVAIVSTPYHGYWKNLALALSGKLDTHFTALWDYGHIKFWSVKTLGILLTEAGFRDLRFYRVGRLPLFAKSMIVVAHR